MSFSIAVASSSTVIPIHISTTFLDFVADNWDFRDLSSYQKFRICGDEEKLVSDNLYLFWNIYHSLYFYQLTLPLAVKPQTKIKSQHF